MGSAFEFVILASAELGEDLLQSAVDEVKRIEILLTEFSDTSATALINRSAGNAAIQVNDEVYAILRRCREISKLTQGSFDITSGILKKLYNFKGEHFKMPGADEIKKSCAKVGYEKIELSEHNNVRLAVPGMHIAFGAIGKGYAADRVKKMLIERGVEAGVINASGDLTAWGKRLDGSPWKIGIADPLDSSHSLLWLPVENASVATSGDYEQFFERKGVRYSHTIDPRTGLPVTGIKSVTIVSQRAELSDALATAVFVMGVEAGMHFIEQLPHTHAIIINDRNKVFMSKHLNLNVYEEQSR
jgi:thiamine biosynthesis lipoprotein